MVCLPFIYGKKLEILLFDSKKLIIVTLLVSSKWHYLIEIKINFSEFLKVKIQIQKRGFLIENFKLELIFEIFFLNFDFTLPIDEAYLAHSSSHHQWTGLWFFLCTQDNTVSSLDSNSNWTTFNWFLSIFYFKQGSTDYGPRTPLTSENMIFEGTKIPGGSCPLMVHESLTWNRWPSGEKIVIALA